MLTSDQHAKTLEEGSQFLSTTELGGRVRVAYFSKRYTEGLNPETHTLMTRLPPGARVLEGELRVSHDSESHELTLNLGTPDDEGYFVAGMGILTDTSEEERLFHQAGSEDNFAKLLADSQEHDVVLKIDVSDGEAADSYPSGSEILVRGYLLYVI